MKLIFVFKEHIYHLDQMRTRFKAMPLIDFDASEAIELGERHELEELDAPVIQTYEGNMYILVYPKGEEPKGGYKKARLLTKHNARTFRSPVEKLNARAATAADLEGLTAFNREMDKQRGWPGDPRYSRFRTWR